MKNRIQIEPIECYSEFEKVFVDILNEHAPLKKKFLRVSYAPHMTKRLRKAIVKRSELKSKYLKFKTQNHLNTTRSSKTFALDCIKKTRKSTTM